MTAGIRRRLIPDRPLYPAKDMPFPSPHAEARCFGRRPGWVDHAAGSVVAGLVCAVFVWSAQTRGLPATAASSIFLFLAIESDVRSRRIPNWLTYGGLALALAAAGLGLGEVGLAAAAGGAALALGLLFVPFALGGIGAGDVKAVMVLGALWGHDLLLPALFWIALAGGALGLALLARRRELASSAGRWLRSIFATVGTQKPTYYAPAPGSAAAGSLPFAVAMGLGASAQQWWGPPWA